MLEINVVVVFNKRMMIVYCKIFFDILKLLKVEWVKKEKKKKRILILFFLDINLF